MFAEDCPKLHYWRIARTPSGKRSQKLPARSGIPQLGSRQPQIRLPMRQQGLLCSVPLWSKTRLATNKRALKAPFDGCLLLSRTLIASLYFTASTWSYVLMFAVV
jgi:hypothetical protein